MRHLQLNASLVLCVCVPSDCLLQCWLGWTRNWQGQAPNLELVRVQWYLPFWCTENSVQSERHYWGWGVVSGLLNNGVFMKLRLMLSKMFSLWRERWNAAKSASTWTGNVCTVSAWSKRTLHTKTDNKIQNKTRIRLLCIARSFACLEPVSFFAFTIFLFLQTPQKTVKSDDVSFVSQLRWISSRLPWQVCWLYSDKKRLYFLLGFCAPTEHFDLRTGRSVSVNLHTHLHSMNATLLLQVNLQSLTRVAHNENLLLSSKGTWPRRLQKRNLF